MSNIVHKTSRNGYLTVCGKKVGKLKYDPKEFIMTKPHSTTKRQEVVDNSYQVLCDKCWNIYDSVRSV